MTLTTGGMYGKENEFNLSMNLSLISFLLSIYLASTEFMFFRFCEKSEFWQRVDNKKLEFNPIKEEKDKNEKRMERIIKALASLSENRG
ncbi:hypothetical protein ES703_96733 [subsurface metagenome]